jgi:hypothetical protein
MFLHAGNNKNLRISKIIGIFDMDNSTVEADTRNFLKTAEKKKQTVALFDEVPKSFIVTEDNTVYLTQISTTSLLGRTEQN